MKTTFPPLNKDGEFIAPNFQHNEKFWLEIWKTVNFHWEKLWKARPMVEDDFTAWWIGNHAGKLFRLREISGMVYIKGHLECGHRRDNKNVK